MATSSSSKSRPVAVAQWTPGVRARTSRVFARERRERGVGDASGDVVVERGYRRGHDARDAERGVLANVQGAVADGPSSDGRVGGRVGVALSPTEGRRVEVQREEHPREVHGRGGRRAVDVVPPDPDDVESAASPKSPRRPKLGAHRFAYRHAPFRVERTTTPFMPRRDGLGTRRGPARSGVEGPRDAPRPLAPVNSVETGVPNP